MMSALSKTLSCRLLVFHKNRIRSIKARPCNASLALAWKQTLLNPEAPLTHPRHWKEYLTITHHKTAKLDSYLVLERSLRPWSHYNESTASESPCLPPSPRKSRVVSAWDSVGSRCEIESPACQSSRGPQTGYKTGSFLGVTTRPCYDLIYSKG